MSDPPPTTTPNVAEDSVNALTRLAQTPRLLLLLLAGWSALGVLSEVFTSSALFLENHGDGEIDLDGALGGFAMGWEGIPLAAVYIYSFRNPVRHRLVFMLGLIHMGTLAASQIYHWLGTSDFTFESIIVPFAGSATLAAVCFMRLFQPTPEHEEARGPPKD